MVYSFLPKWLVFVLIAGVCTVAAKRGRTMVFEQARISKEQSRVETELLTARKIQLHALPLASQLIAGKDTCFDLASSIIPAREVGGDFYDFFYVDPTHLALVIADVSGKGVPAALFMMISKITLDASASSGKTPGQLLTIVNHQLCEKYSDNMFVTVWLGVLDLTTGELTSANAGHENPIICHTDGSVEVIRTRHGLALGCMDGVRYRDERICLKPGDTLFVYTDGIPEAHDTDSSMYGMDRLVCVLHKVHAMPLQALLDSVQKDVNEFVGEAPQFDDSTMLAVRLNTLLVREGVQVRPDYESFATVKKYVTRQMEEARIPLKKATQMQIGLDEMYSNIVRHSGAVWAEVICRHTSDSFVLILRDNGIPYDPTSQASPDVSLDVQERQVGGLGIFITRSMVDKLEYQHIDGFNEITIVLSLDDKKHMTGKIIEGVLR